MPSNESTSIRSNGVVYTRRWVVDLILDVAGYTAGAGIVDKIAVEPSCGEGAFLVAMVDRLATELKLSHRPWIDITHSVIAYDLDTHSVAKATQNVIDALILHGCAVATAVDIAKHWMRNADFVLSDFPLCDFIIGNPPYIRATEIPREQRSAYCKTLKSFSMGCDIYIAFFDHALDMLRPEGTLCYICADRWLQNAYGKRLRARVNSQYSLVSIIRMHGVNAFEDEVDSYPAVTLIRNVQSEKLLDFVNCSTDFNSDDVPHVERWLSNHSDDISSTHFEAFSVKRPEGNDVYPLGDSHLVRFVSRCCNLLPSIEDSGIKIGIGIATGRDKVFITDNPNLVEPERMVPIFIMRDYRRGCADHKKWLVNPWDDDGNLVNLDDWPKLKAYFEANESDLRQRNVAKHHPEAWFRTIDKLHPDLLNRDLLLMPDMATTSDPILSHGLYPAHACYWIASDVWDLHVLGGLIMADTTRRFIDALGVKMRGGTLRFQAQYLRLLHLPPYDSISVDLKKGLAKAFDNADRNEATKLSEIAYEEAMA